MENKNKGKLKEQNSSRFTEPKNGLTVTKGKGTGEDGWKGRDKGRKKKGGITISMNNVGGVLCGLYNTEKTSSDFTASYYADDSDCEGVCGVGTW